MDLHTKQDMRDFDSVELDESKINPGKVKRKFGHFHIPWLKSCTMVLEDVLLHIRQEI